MGYLIACLIALFPLAAMAADSRVISGSLTYSERIALPPDAEMIVELRDSAGLVVARTVERTEAAQVPLPFTVDGPANTPLTVRSALLMDDTIRWMGDPVMIDAGQAPVELGGIRLRVHKPMGFASMMSCGELIAELGFVGKIARLRIGGSYIDLAADPAGSGSRFISADDPGTWVKTRGDVATLSLEGTELPECRQMLPDMRYVARGNEPGWSIVIEAGRLRYVGDHGATQITAPLPEPRIVNGARRYAPEGVDLVLSLVWDLCHDDMTGMPRPDRVRVETGARMLRGCGGDPRELLAAHPWRVDDIAGAGVIDGSDVSLRFNRENRVSGSGGCNRFTASYELTGEGLAIRPGAATMMACPGALMTQEQMFLDALARATRFEISFDGALRLLAGADVVLSARR